MVKTAKRLKDEIKEKEKALKICEDTIKESIGYYEGLSFKGKTLCTYKAQERTQFDSAKFAEEHPDQVKDYQKISNFRVLRFSSSKEK